MSVTERRRHALHEWAKRVGDEEVAATLMELLPPVGWADVATKRDLDHLAAELRSKLGSDLAVMGSEIRTKIAAVHGSVASLEGRVQRDLRLHTYGIMGSIWASLGVALAVLSR